MSELGQSRRFRQTRTMSGLPLAAEVRQAFAAVANGQYRRSRALFDHLVGAADQGEGKREVERFRRL